MSVFDVILMQSSSSYLDLLAFRALWLLLLFFPQKRAFKIMQIIPKVNVSCTWAMIAACSATGHGEGEK